MKNILSVCSYCGKYEIFQDRKFKTLYPSQTFDLKTFAMKGFFPLNCNRFEAKMNMQIEAMAKSPIYISLN